MQAKGPIYVCEIRVGDGRTKILRSDICLRDQGRQRRRDKKKRQRLVLYASLHASLHAQKKLLRISPILHHTSPLLQCYFTPYAHFGPTTLTCNYFDFCVFSVFLFFLFMFFYGFLLFLFSHSDGTILTNAGSTERCKSTKEEPHFFIPPNLYTSEFMIPHPTNYPYA